MRSSLRPLSGAFSFASAATALSLVAASPAMALGGLVSATPAANMTASDVRTLSLTFSEPVVVKQSGARLVMTAMPGMAHHKPMTVSGFTTTVATDGRTLVLTLPRALPVGTYSLSWHIMTHDGHRSEGGYSFSTR